MMLTQHVSIERQITTAETFNTTILISVSIQDPKDGKTGVHLATEIQ